MTALRRGVAFGLAGLALLLVFWAYLQPDMAVALALQLWACF